MLITCSECKGSVADQAEKCPHCGASPRAVKPSTRSVWNRPVDGKTYLGLFVVLLVLAYCTYHSSTEPLAASTAAVATAPADAPVSPPPPPPVDLSKPIFTRENAILCPTSSFESQLAGHSVADIKRLFDEPGDDVTDRNYKASLQDCEVYQGGVQFTLLSARDRKALAEATSVFHLPASTALLNSKEWLLLEDHRGAVDGPACCLVTRADQLRN